MSQPMRSSPTNAVEPGPPHATPPEIWRYDSGRYKVYVEDQALKEQIASWQDCRRHGVYYNRRFQVIGWDLIVPARLYRRVARLCGLPLRKQSLKRIAHGQRLGALAKARNHLGLPNGGSFSNNHFEPAPHSEAIRRSPMVRDGVLAMRPADG